MYKIEYTVNFGKRKNFYITVSKGKVTIKAPLNAKLKDIEMLVEKNKNWIIKNIEKSLKNLKPQKVFLNGGEFYILGEKCILYENFYNKKRFSIQKNDNRLDIFIPVEFKGADNSEMIKKCFEKWFSAFAEKEIMESFFRLSEITKIYANKITVKKMTRSWGRCLSNGNISINKFVAEYDKRVIDYVVLHELCHRVHFNHSKEFWTLVEKYMPDYKFWREKLK